MILPQHQPHLPGEMPHAYLVRTDAPTEHEYDHHDEMTAAAIADQIGCIIRRDNAMREWRGTNHIRMSDVRIGKTDIETNVVAFHDGHLVTIRPSQFDWSERQVWDCEVGAVYDASTWEDVTALVDLEALADRVVKAIRN